MHGSSLSVRGYGIVLKKIFSAKTDNVFIQLVRYTIGGGLAFIVDFASLFALSEFLSIHYLISGALAFVLGALTNYILSVVWIFSKKALKNKGLEVGIFVLIGVIGLGLNEIVMWFFTEHMHMHYLVSKVISTVFVYLWNFAVRRYFFFR